MVAHSYRDLAAEEVTHYYRCYCPSPSELSQNRTLAVFQAPAKTFLPRVNCSRSSTTSKCIQVHPSTTHNQTCRSRTNPSTKATAFLNDRVYPKVLATALCLEPTNLLNIESDRRPRRCASSERRKSPTAAPTTLHYSSFPSPSRFLNPGEPAQCVLASYYFVAVHPR
jgi:hypothetical protein